MKRPIGQPNSNSTDVRYVVLGIASGVILLALFVFGQRESVSVDSDNCLQDELPPAQTVVLLDPSDSLSVVQQGSVVSRLLEALEDSMPERTEIRVYTVAKAGRRESAPEFRVCVPPNPDDISVLESLWNNRSIAERGYTEGFRLPLRRRLDVLLDVPSDSVSPIVEAVQAAVVDAFRPRGASVPRTVFLVSDMVQNSSDLSFFREASDFGTFVRDPNYGTLRVDLSGVRLIVFLLARRGIAGRLQAGQLKTFWEEYFIDQNASAGARPRWIEVEG